MAVLTQRDEHVKRKANIIYMLGIEGIYLYNNIYIYALCVSSPVSSSSHFQKYAEKGRHQNENVIIITIITNQFACQGQVWFLL